MLDLDADDSAVFPLALKTSIMPLEPTAYSYDVSSEGGLTYFNFTLNDFNDELYSFTVWGRVYGTDGQDADPPIDETATDSNQAIVTDTVPTSTIGAANSDLLSGALLVSSLMIALRG